MSQPVVVINVYGGSAPCGCGQAKAIAKPLVLHMEEAMESDATRGTDAPPPVTSDPPCDTCGVTYTLGQDVIFFNGPIGPKADGGFPITKVSLTLLNAFGGFVSAVGLPDAKAGDDLSGSYTMPTKNASQAVFSYIGADGLAYQNRLAVTIRPA